MALPNEPVTLSIEQVRELSKKLADMRHDLNNSLSLMAAASDIVRRKPESADRMWNTFSDQPRKIMDAVGRFSAELESALQIKRS